jgi:hypothetical protein
MNVGFDFDKVFIDYPPFIPYFLIDFLYKVRAVFRKSSKNFVPHYRIPGPFEQNVRILSHHPIFRHQISKNVDFLKAISSDKKIKKYLVSSRFSFLKNRTDGVLKKYQLKKYFDGIYFNYENKQPHLFKEETIKKLKIDTYIDDDIQLSVFLAQRNPRLTIFWVSDGRKTDIKLPKNVIKINNLQEVKKHIKQHA